MTDVLELAKKYNVHIEVEYDEAFKDFNIKIYDPETLTGMSIAVIEDDLYWYGEEFVDYIEKRIDEYIISVRKEREK